MSEVTTWFRPAMVASAASASCSVATRRSPSGSVTWMASGIAVAISSSSDGRPTVLEHRGDVAGAGTQMAVGELLDGERCSDCGLAGWWASA